MIFHRHKDRFFLIDTDKEGEITAADIQPDADITVGSASVKDTGVLTFLSTGNTTVNDALDNAGECLFCYIERFS